MGKFEARQRLTVVRKLCGHDSMGPSGVLLQSIERINLPISPPPTSQSPARASFRLKGRSTSSSLNVLLDDSRADREADARARELFAAPQGPARSPWRRTTGAEPRRAPARHPPPWSHAERGPAR